MKDSQGFITFAQEEAESGSSLHLDIFEKGRLAGKVCLYQINDRIKTASIGYYIGADFEGRGLVTQAVKQLAAFAYQTRGLNRLEIKVISQNKRSLAVPQRLRFSYEGCLRESGEFQGKPADQLIVSVLKKEFQSKERF
ncbi:MULTISPECIES: GNAT family N-acetyltransferase [Bacillus]|uniref:GNAT family N-acetyltransferase n=1 Tax=Bacillus TaxID=1386 RepID=UPI0004057B4C|nr:MULTISPECIES: GNAT family protein [Bacillus]QHZ47771.1 GNAT family N-acetyltransferase [Bacillus sp. NSP9.1]